jgi:hypothetical protein
MVVTDIAAEMMAFGDPKREGALLACVWNTHVFKVITTD